MRSLHRWLTTLFAVFLLFLGTTGLMIQADDLLALHGLGPHPAREIAGINGGAQSMDPNYVAMGPGVASPDAAQTPLPAQPAPLVGVALATLNRVAPHAPVSSVEFLAMRGTPQFDVSFADGRPALSINAVTGASAIKPPDPAAGGGQSFHDYVKAFHSGGVLAAPGLWLIFLSGLSLLTLSLSGTWVYIKMWRQRNALGRAEMFWQMSTEGLWRRVHRYISIIAALFIAYIAVTGMLLSVDDIVVRFSADYPAAMLRAGLPGGGPPPSMAAPAPLALGDIAAVFTRIDAAARTAAPNRVPLSITINAGRDAQVIALGTHPALYTFNPTTAAWTNPATAGIPSVSPYIGSLRMHQIFKRLHRGDILGANGRWVLVTSDLCLLYFGISGVVMYFQMLGRRRKIGTARWFW